jgi:hypothetical protein
MIALDTNILVYAHREESPWHDAAYKLIEELSEARAPWVVPWPCIHEFLAIATHPKIFDPPTPLEAALAQVEAWLQSPSLILLSEAEGYWETLKSALQVGRVAGPQVHDARVAAICRIHGIEELWSADRDLSRFPGVAVRNPLIGQ